MSKPIRRSHRSLGSSSQSGSDRRRIARRRLRVRGAERPRRGGRSPSPGRPGKTERIRFFDVKHIKAELTLDTKKREVRGTVTHTLSPLHPYLKQVELDCGSKPQGHAR